jgi:hypothetical protein
VGRFQRISESADFQVVSQALRIAPCARISIPSKGMPDLSRELTVTEWILKSSISQP